MEKYLIHAVHAREMLDSRGNPTIEVVVTVLEETTGRFISEKALVPSGASTGKFEAVELRDGEKRYLGKGVSKAVYQVNRKIAEALVGENVLNQEEIDRIMITQDGTKNKSELGANAILGVSMACARAAAKALGIPLYRYLGGSHVYKMPVPMMNILNGGVHSRNTVDFQEFMIMPVGATSQREGIRICVEIYHKLKELLDNQGKSTGVGDEGGFAPDLQNAEAVLNCIIEAIKVAGYVPGADIKIAMDVAASELYDEKSKMYFFPGESKMCGEKIYKKTEEMITYYEKLVDAYPIASIEDGLNEEDYEGWKELTKRLGNKVQLVGDDLFVTNPEKLKQGISLGIANAILIKVNQIGTVSEAMKAIEIAKTAGYKTVISHRSGETEDTFIADLSVAVNAGQIKTGAPCRGERTAKYNQLMRIEEELSIIAKYENPF